MTDFDPGSDLDIALRWEHALRWVRRLQLTGAIVMMGATICFAIPGNSFLGVPQLVWAALVVTVVPLVLGGIAYLWRCPGCAQSLGFSFDPPACPRCDLILRVSPDYDDARDSDGDDPDVPHDPTDPVRPR